MPYQTGTCSSLADLKTTIEAFAQTNGWTMVNGVLNKSGVHVKFDTPADNVRFLVGTGDDGLGTLTDVFDHTDDFYSGGDGLQICNVRNGQTIQYPATYHLISLSNPDNIFCVINYNIEHCQHLAFGNFQKYGTWGGGQYGSATAYDNQSTQPSFLEYSRVNGAARAGSGAYLFAVEEASGGSGIDPLPNAVVKCDVDGMTWRAFMESYNSSQTFRNERSCSAADWSQPFLTQLSTINLQPVMCPPVLSIGRADSHYSVAGIMPHVRYLRVDYYNPGDIIEVGAQKWIVFPHTSVTDFNGGWAIKYDGP